MKFNDSKNMMSNVFRFTTGNSDFGMSGDRILALFIDKDNKA